LNERGCVIDAKRIGLIHHDVDVGVLCGSTQASGLSDAIGAVLIHDRDLLDFTSRRCGYCDRVIDLRSPEYRGCWSHLENVVQAATSNLVSECHGEKWNIRSRGHLRNCQRQRRYVSAEHRTKLVLGDQTLSDGRCYGWVRRCVAG